MVTLAICSAAVLVPSEGVFYVNRRAIPVWGMSAPKAFVSVSVNSRPVAQGRADEEGRYLFPEVLLEEGENTIEVVARKGSKVTRRSLRVVVDTQPPEVKLLRPSEEAVLKGPDIVVEGRTEPGAEVQVLADGKLAGSTSADPEGEFKLVAKGVELGRRALKVKALDRAGNSSSVEVEVSVEAIPPTLDISSPRVDEVVAKRLLFVKGFTEPEATVTVKVQGVQVGEVKADHRGMFKVGPVSFETEGRASVSVIARDQAGWTRTIERFIAIDFTPPPIDVRFPPPGRPVESPKGELVVLTEPWASVVLRKGISKVAEAVADEKGLAVLTGFTLLPGRNEFTIEATDRAGHMRQQEVVLLYDRSKELLRRLGYPEELIETIEKESEPSTSSIRAEFK